MRSCQDLGGTHDLGQDFVPHLRSQGAWSRKVDPAAKDFFQVDLQASQGEVASRSPKFDENVDVALGICLVASNRAKQSKAQNASRSQVFAMKAEYP